jgi:DnaK suppressor protein
MDKRTRDKYRRKLEQAYQEVESLVSRTEEAGRAADLAAPEDLAEKAANSYTKEFLFHQSDSERVQLHLVEEALVRSKSKEFGLCQSCGEPIERKRLDAVPWARCCRTCQEEEEHEGPPAGEAGL